MISEKPESHWADNDASRQLPILRAQGEGQNLEFMKEFPENTRELAKEIAAFATSNAGTILIGVDNAGDCRGLPNVVTAIDRDSLLRRVEGICHGPVKPSITPTARFAQEGDRTVLVLTIPKGSQPIYYANGVPYLRHITSSRPAEPHEVIELIQSALSLLPGTRQSIEEQPDKRVQFLADLMRNLVRVRIFGEELDERMFNPWLELWRAQFADVATELRRAAAQKIALDEKLETVLFDAAEALNAVAKLQLHLGSGDELQRAANRALKLTDSLLERIGPLVVPHVAPQQLLDQLEVLQRELTILETEAEKARADGSVEELQTRSAELGSKILFTAQYGVNRLAPDLRSTLMKVGHQLHLVETHRLYLDGGASMDRIIGNVVQAIAVYNQAMASIQRGRE